MAQLSGRHFAHRRHASSLPSYRGRHAQKQKPPSGGRFACAVRDGFACSGAHGVLIFENDFSKAILKKAPGAGEGIRTLDPNLGKVVLYP
jgi:hypothetical protein